MSRGRGREWWPTFGVSWQVAPTLIYELMADEKSEAAKRAFAAMLTMKKIDIAELQRAYDGAEAGEAVIGSY